MTKYMFYLDIFMFFLFYHPIWKVYEEKLNMFIVLFYYTFVPKIKQNIMKKVLIMVIGSWLLIVGCNEKKQTGVKAPTRVCTEIISVNSQTNGQTYVGIVEEREATAVSFTSMGVVKRVLVNEGQMVSKGQLIAEMDDTQARNLLSGAEAQMAQANDALGRYKMLHDAGSLPEVQWVEIQSKVAQAKSQLELSRKNLADCRLIAPVSGIIGRKMLGAGETAMPSQAVVSILDISSVKVKVSIPESEIGDISNNTSSIIKVEAINGSFSGGAIEKGVQADALTHTYDIRIHVENSERKLLPGMVASVQFTTTKSQPTRQLSVPVTAVQRKADGSLFVWMVDNDSTAHRTPVTTGETIGNRIVVVTGISDGNRVVTEGYQKLSEGTKVIY
jgi:RND family efflux transporter MFP subunit